MHVVKALSETEDRYYVPALAVGVSYQSIPIHKTKRNFLIHNTVSILCSKTKILCATTRLKILKMQFWGVLLNR